MVFFCDLRQLLDVYGVTREVYGVRATISCHSKVLSVYNESDTFVSRPVLAGRGSDVEHFSCDANISLLPVAETKNTGPGGEVLCAIVGCYYVTAVEESASELIEVIGVVLVTQENGVDVR